ncbi:MAG: double-stranded uracil-DNA glycosylase, partial [Pseudonocardiales bacterium]|nr:double-stranded uracil-DNA glycosylase [Pseudonocardiales bacterium]
FGPQDLRIAEARVWVLPNPSGLNRRWSLPALVAEYSRLREVAANVLDPDGYSLEFAYKSWQH